MHQLPSRTAGQHAHPRTGISPFCRPASLFSPCALARCEPPKLNFGLQLPFPAALTLTARLGLHLPGKRWTPCGGTAGPEEGRWSWGFCCCPCEETLTTGTDGREKGLLLSPRSREGAELPASISPTSAIGPRSASGAAEPVMPAGGFVLQGLSPLSGLMSN